jgi:hypothetical protein
VVAVVVTAVAVAASYRDPAGTSVPHGGSVVTAALPVTRSALEERRLVGTDASGLSALAGARAGTVDATLRTQRQKTELQLLKTRTSGGGTAYLKVEKPRFLFLEGSANAAVAPVVAAAALPDACAVRAGASAVRAASSTDCPAAGASAPITDACSSASSAALAEGGEGFHLSGGPPPSLSSSSSSPNDEFSGVADGESPYCSRSRYSSSRCSLRSRRRILFSFLRAARSCSRRCAAWATSRARGGSDREASTVTLC